jgi:hypothetical protein
MSLPFALRKTGPIDVLRAPHYTDFLNDDDGRTWLRDEIAAGAFTPAGARAIAAYAQKRAAELVDTDPAAAIEVSRLAVAAADWAHGAERATSRGADLAREVFNMGVALNRVAAGQFHENGGGK